MSARRRRLTITTLMRRVHRYSQQEPPARRVPKIVADKYVPTLGVTPSGQTPLAGEILWPGDDLVHGRSADGYDPARP